MNILEWLKRRQKPTLKEAAQETIVVASSLTEALHDLAHCSCADGLRRTMDRARRIAGERTRETDKGSQS